MVRADLVGEIVARRGARREVSRPIPIRCRGDVALEFEPKSPQQASDRSPAQAKSEGMAEGVEFELSGDVLNGQ
jgi:hypothetical protein